MSDEVETKAGHPPALKVGGMRVARSSSPPPSADNPQIPPKENEDGDDAVRGVGGLNTQPKDLIVQAGGQQNASKQEMKMHQKEIRHMHDKGINAGKHNDSHAHQRPERDQSINEPRNTGSYH